MAVHRDEKSPPDPETGLDARLEKVVPVENAVGFLLAGDGSQPGRVYPLTRNTSLVGRAEHADVRIAQPAISNEHARITNGSQGFEIEDLNSVNGTFINGVRISKSKLSRGDRLMLGNVEFTFLLEKTPDATMALLPPRPRRTSLTEMRTITATHATVQPRRRASDAEDDGLTFVDVVRGSVNFYQTAKPHLPFVAKLSTMGLVLGIASAAALPPPNVAIAEAKLHAVKKVNPVDGESRSAHEPDSLQFFLDPERSFVSPALVATTIEKLEGRPPDDSRVGDVQGRLKLESVGERLFRASYVEPGFGKDRVPSLKLLETHINNYFTSDIEKGLKALDTEAKFLGEKLATASTDLTAINEELAAFKKANADDLPETSDQAHQSRYYLDTRKAELTAQIARLAGELAVDEGSLKEGSPLAGSKFQASQVYRSSLADLKKRLSEAYSKGWGEQHPEVLQMKNEMQRLEKVIEQEMTSETSAVDRSADPAVSGLRAKVGVQRAQLQAARIELQEVERNLAKIKRAVTTMPAVAARLDDLQRKYESTKRLHDQLSDQAHKAKLQVEVERLAAHSRYEIITPPYLSRPNAPKTFGQRAAFGFGIGLVFAVLISFLREARKLVARQMASTTLSRG